MESQRLQQVKIDATDSGCDARSLYDGSDYISIVSYNMHGYDHGLHTVRDLKNAVTLKTGFEVRQGHGKCHNSIERT